MNSKPYEKVIYLNSFGRFGIFNKLLLSNTIRRTHVRVNKINNIVLSIKFEKLTHIKIAL